MLREAPALEAKALFEWLMRKYPGRYHYGQEMRWLHLLDHGSLRLSS
jgi:hypothetical protein